MNPVKCLTLLIFLGVSVTAQSVAEQLLANPYESTCGKPLSGEVFDYREGRISSVTRDNILTFQQVRLNGDPKVENLRVRLVGVDADNGGIRLNVYLRKSIVGKNVTIAGNKKSASDPELIGSVWASATGDLNQSILKAKLAKFAEPDYKAVSEYSVCVLRQIAGQVD